MHDAYSIFPGRMGTRASTRAQEEEMVLSKVPSPLPPSPQTVSIIQSTFVTNCHTEVGIHPKSTITEEEDYQIMEPPSQGSLAHGRKGVCHDHFHCYRNWCFTVLSVLVIPFPWLRTVLHAVPN